MLAATFLEKVFKHSEIGLSLQEVICKVEKRVLIMTQWFDPEPTFKGLLFAQELVARGFDVEVMTGFPNYLRCPRRHSNCHRYRHLQHCRQ